MFVCFFLYLSVHLCFGLRVTVDQTLLELSQSKADLATETDDLTALQAQGRQFIAHQKEQEENAASSMREHCELLRETQSSIDFMTQSRQQMIESIEVLRVSRDDHASKIREI